MTNLIKAKATMGMELKFVNKKYGQISAEEAARDVPNFCGVYLESQLKIKSQSRRVGDS